MDWLSPGLPSLLTPKSEVMTERIPVAWLAQVPVSLAFPVGGSRSGRDGLHVTVIQLFSWTVLSIFLNQSFYFHLL